MKITYDKPAPPNVTVTFTPEEFILLGVVMGKIGGVVHNPIRKVFDFDTDLYGKVLAYISEHNLTVDLPSVCDSLVKNSMTVNDQTWSLK